MIRLLVGIGLMAVTCGGPVYGQAAAALKFDVASVRPTANADGRALLQATPGRLIMTNLALRRLILIAYGVQDYQLVGVPAWIDSAHYDIQAKADGNPSVQQMEGPMLQVLLEERFKLALHRETQQLPVFELSVGKSGAKLQPSKEGSCTPYSVDSPPPATTTTGEPRPNFCGFRRPAADGLNQTLEGTAVTMVALATNLSRSYTSVLGRNVIDRTGLTGTFDIHLKWAFDPLNGPRAGSDATPPDLAGPSIFTALQEQLGLKLESTKGPVEVLVLDHVEKPSDN
jgi:uncharacterized protein (TIGR03435 family)